MKFSNQEAYWLLSETLLIMVLVAVFALMVSSINWQQGITKQSLIKLQHIIELARSEAVKRSQGVILCPSRDAKTCANASGSYIVLRLTHQVNPLYSFKLTKQKENLLWHMFGQAYQLKFASTGLTTNNGSICSMHWCLYVNQAGKTYISYPK